jgi:signal transduction histidine kinase
LRRLIPLFLLVVSHFASAQTKKEQVKIDSILSVYVGPSAGGKGLLEEAITLSQQSDDYLLGQLYFKLAEEHLAIGAYDSAGKYYPLSLPPLELAGDSIMLGEAYIGMGYVLYLNGDYTQSLNYNLKAEKIFRTTKVKKLLGRALKRMAGIFIAMKDYGTSEKYLNEALTIAEKEFDTINIVRTLNTLSVIYDETADFQKVDPVLKRAIALAEAIDCIRCMAISYSQWGISLHFRGQYKEAIGKYLKEYELNKLEELTFDQFFVYQNIAEAYFELRELTLALAYSDSAMVLAKTENAPQFIHDAYKIQYKIYKAKSDFDKALAALEMKGQYVDTLFSQEKARIQEDMKVAYETNRKEELITLLEKENTIKVLEAEQSKQLRLYLIVVVILLMLAAGILFSRYRLKQRTARLLDAKNIDLQNLNRVKDRLFAIISHDLKSPLSSFHTVTSTLNQYYEQISPDDIKRYLAKLEIAAKSLEDQMKNLLEWSLQQISERSLKPEAFELRDMAEKLRSFFQLNLEVKRQTIYIEIEVPIHLETDKEYLQTVLRNLLSNAIKFTPVEGSIWLRANVIDNNVVIEVEDSGIGIASGDFHKLFTLESDKKSIGNSTEKGTGLGLVLVKEMIEKLGGVLSLTSELGKGTTFTIRMTGKQLKKAA